ADEIADPLGVAGLGVVRRAIGESQLPFRVRKQGKVESELLGEGRLVRDGVEAGAQDLHSLVLVLLDAVAEPATLVRSTRGVRFGIEPEDDVPAAVVGEPPRLARLVLDLEFGSDGAGFEHGGTSARIMAKKSGPARRTGG